MSGRVWTVEYIGEGAEMVRRDLEAHGPIVRCGGAGAIWRATIVPCPNDATRVELYPVNAHTIDPSDRIVEILIPPTVVG